MPRKARIDSAPEAVRIMAGANRPISAPSNVPLDSKDVPFFASVVDEFARADWTAHQLELAAMLARSMADLEFEQRKLREEGSVMSTERGTPVVNPRKTVVQMLAGTILAMRRSLALHARATGGDQRDIGKRRDMSKGIETELSDELLARPS